MAKFAIRRLTLCVGVKFSCHTPHNTLTTSYIVLKENKTKCLCWPIQKTCIARPPKTYYIYSVWLVQCLCKINKTIYFHMCSIYSVNTVVIHNCFAITFHGDFVTFYFHACAPRRVKLAQLLATHDLYSRASLRIFCKYTQHIYVLIDTSNFMLPLHILCAPTSWMK